MQSLLALLLRLMAFPRPLQRPCQDLMLRGGMQLLQMRFMPSLRMGLGKWWSCLQTGRPLAADGFSTSSASQMVLWSAIRPGLLPKAILSAQDLTSLTLTPLLQDGLPCVLNCDSASLVLSCGYGTAS